MRKGVDSKQTPDMSTIKFNIHKRNEAQNKKNLLILIKYVKVI